MAALDVSDAFDPELIQRGLTVIRRSEHIVDGIAELRPTFFRNVCGVVTPATKNDLQMGSDETHQEKSFSVVARFPLRGEAPGMQPDIVLFRGNHYKVVSLGDSSHWGPGFVAAIATSIDSSDLGAATWPPTMGETIFATNMNSGLIAAI